MDLRSIAQKGCTADSGKVRERSLGLVSLMLFTRLLELYLYSIQQSLLVTILPKLACLNFFQPFYQQLHSPSSFANYHFFLTKNFLNKPLPLPPLLSFART